ncbi:MAG: glycosyltransferase [Candidatus Erginobacter occultus]|nr:glycosyltransferase [Candidatus Erginobacter occultus]
MGENPKITVGIVTRNRREKLGKAIQSVYEQEFPNLEILVVDNASDDGTSEMLAREYPVIRLLRLEENRGCPGGRNFLYRHARGEIIVNLDDDGLLGEGALSRLVETFFSDPAIGVVAGRLLDLESSIPKNLPDQGWETGIFWAGVSAFRRKMLEEIGFFPEDFFFFKEEEFLSLKALDAGWRIVYHPGFIVRHPPIRHRAGEDTRRDYYLFRNPLFVVIELFPGIYLWKYLFLRIASYALISRRRGTFPAYCRAVGAVPKRLARSLFHRQPVSKAALRRYFLLRGNLPTPEGEG